MRATVLYPFAALPLLVILASPAVGEEVDGPWSTLRSVRDSLVAAGPTAADFLQTYVPAGFSTGETESGSLAIDLPECLRWDYQEPYPKTFLLCGETAHYWNPEDRVGRRYRVQREEEPGLDLVLLGVDELRGRYQVESQASEQGHLRFHLLPLRAVGELAEATLEVDPESLRLTELTYKDREGNLTRFELSAYHALKRPDAFTPPSDIEWREEEQP